MSRSDVPFPETSPTGIFGGQRTAFACVAGGFVLLCLRGGMFGSVGDAPLSIAGFHLPAGRFIALFVLTWFFHIALLPLFPRGLSPARRRALLVALALVCRLALLPHPPSDDVNRYLWEGRLVAEGIDPYRHAPNDPALASLAADDPFHTDINHPDVSAAYPPLALLLFSGSVRIAYGTGAMKLLVLVFDMVCVWMILLLLRHRELPERWAILYALNPLTLYAFAGQAHLDAIQNAFLLAALVLYDRRRPGWMFLCLALAVQSKYVAAMALPFLVRRDNLRFLPVFFLGLPVPMLPFLDGGIAPIFDGLSRFGTAFAFNGPVHAPLRFLVFGGDMVPARIVCQFLLVLALLAGLTGLHPERSPRHRDDPVSGVLFAMGASILLSPTVHFWYLSWVLILIPLRPTASWIVAGLTAAAYFVAAGNSHFTGRWDLPAVAQIAEWGPPGLLLLLAGWERMRRRGAPLDPVPPRSVSAVIPAMDEADRIADCVAAIRRDPAVREIIVVDGGSGDDTVSVARKAGARVIPHIAPPESGGGRGGQIRAGVDAASGDAIAVVHADTRVPAGAFSRMVRLLRRNPDLIGGTYGGVFDGFGWRLRLLEFANDLRAAAGIGFGDQVQFFRRRPMAESGLFPDIPLMEDVELSLRMRRLGRVAFLFGDTRISSRRWTAGISRRGGLVLVLVATYFWKRLRGTPDTAAMFRRYYEGAGQTITANRDHPD
jgi:hypothetical protein